MPNIDVIPLGSLTASAALNVSGIEMSGKVTMFISGLVLASQLRGQWREAGGHGSRKGGRTEKFCWSYVQIMQSLT